MKCWIFFLFKLGEKIIKDYMHEMQKVAYFGKALMTGSHK